MTAAVFGAQLHSTQAAASLKQARDSGIASQSKGDARAAPVSTSDQTGGGGAGATRVKNRQGGARALSTIFFISSSGVWNSRMSTSMSSSVKNLAGSLSISGIMWPTALRYDASTLPFSSLMSCHSWLSTCARVAERHEQRCKPGVTR